MTEEIKAGGQAFPQQIAVSPMGDCYPAYPGMTLRDYFAAHAPITITEALVATAAPTSNIGTLTREERIEVLRMHAQMRMDYADAMIAAREAA